MTRQTRHRYTPFDGALTAPVHFRSASVPAEAIYPQHRHACGELVCSFTGVMEVKLADRHYLAPPQYGIWLPPLVEHTGLNRYETSFCSVYVSAELCSALPRTTCAITITPLVRAILEHLRTQPPQSQDTDGNQRLLRVLVDQLADAATVETYLPTSDDAILGAVLRTLEADPGDTRTLAELARAANTTERTLMRRCQRDLGMSFSAWRQRLRVVRAIARLDSGQTVEHIALDLGYGSASAFITMFRRMTGMTPEEFRKNGVRRGT